MFKHAAFKLNEDLNLCPNVSLKTLGKNRVRDKLLVGAMFLRV